MSAIENNKRSHRVSCFGKISPGAGSDFHRHDFVVICNNAQPDTGSTKSRIVRPRLFSRINRIKQYTVFK